MNHHNHIRLHYRITRRTRRWRPHQVCFRCFLNNASNALLFYYVSMQACLWLQTLRRKWYILRQVHANIKKVAFCVTSVSFQQIVSHATVVRLVCVMKTNWLKKSLSGLSISSWLISWHFRDRWQWRSNDFPKQILKIRCKSIFRESCQMCDRYDPLLPLSALLFPDSKKLL